MNQISFIGVGDRSYATAYGIQNFCMQFGYNAPVDKGTGQRHPGTDVNAKIRPILNDRSFCHTFSITQNMGVDTESTEFIGWLIDNGLLPDSYNREQKITLYEAPLVRGVIHKMLGGQTKDVDMSGPLWSYPSSMPQPRFVRHDFTSAKQRQKKELKGVRSPLFRRIENV